MPLNSHSSFYLWDIFYIFYLIQEGVVYAVEFSQRSGRDLLGVAKKRTNIVPIIEDARHPHKYRMVMGELIYLCLKNNLTLNPGKTSDPAEYKSNLDLKINNTALPMATHPKVLGLTLDPKLAYSTHIHNISVQAHKPLQMIKALTATGWGKQKELLHP